MTTRVRSKLVEEPFKSMYIGFAYRYPASFFGAAAKLGKQYIVEKELFEKMMVWSFIEKIYSVPDSKDYSGTQYPYVRITKLYDSFREYCRRYRMEPCAFKTFKNELVSNLELCFTKRGSQHAIYLVHANHPAFQASRSSSKYDFDVFASPSTLDIWQLFGRKKPWVKYDEKVDIKYYIRGGPTICLRKNFVLAKDEL